MRTLVIILVAVGVLFGAAEVAVAAAAETLGSKSIAAPLLALWGAGSLAVGLLAAGFGSGTHDGTGLARVLIALSVGHLSLTVAAGKPRSATRPVVENRLSDRVDRRLVDAVRVPVGLDE